MAKETVIGGLCFGAPILDEGQHSIAAISVSTPLIRMSQDGTSELSTQRHLTP
jgi:DNA-binding IclR family transcriptional regulator